MIKIRWYDQWVDINVEGHNSEAGGFYETYLKCIIIEETAQFYVSLKYQLNSNIM